MAVYAITTLRLSPALMTSLKKEADSRGTSVNKLISAILAAYIQGPEGDELINDDEESNEEA